jgi:glutaredoxin
MKKLELFTTPACPHCLALKKTIQDVLPAFADKYSYKEFSAASPIGYLKSLRNNIHSAPTLLIDGKVVASAALSEKELTLILNTNL